MTRLTLLWSVVLLSSCSTKKELVEVKSIDSTILHVDTTTVLGEHYKAIFRTDNMLYVTKANGDTVLKESNLVPDFEFSDFNGDGHRDLLISYISNIPVKDLFLFDIHERNFKKVEGFSNYPESKPITGTPYFYSYHRSGCADMNWDSDLFYIDQFKTNLIGNISGKQCEGEKIGILITRIDGEAKKLIDTFPIEAIDNYPENKWGFVKEYWTKNYNKFNGSQ
jgi:hypothetical protein